MNIEMLEPTTPATQPTKEITMDNFKAPSLVGIIMQALEQHIEAMVDKRFNERMANTQLPNMVDIKDIITEMIDEKFEEHTNEYDHEEYDQCVRNVDDAGLDDIEVKITDVLRSLPITLNID